MTGGREERRLTLAELEETLKDPELVYLNMLRGGIAKPSIRQMLHLHGADALARWDSVEEIAALRAENAALKRRNALWRKAAKKYRRGGLAVADALELSDEDHARELSALRAEVAALRAAVGSAVDALCSEKRRRSGGEYHYPFDVVDAGVTVGMDALAAGLGERALACVRELIGIAENTSGMTAEIEADIATARRLFGSGSGAKEEGR